MKLSESDNKLVEEADDFRMPWGAYRGQILSDLPSSYLKWIAENVKQRNICDMADAVWRFREKHNVHIK